MRITRKILATVLAATMSICSFASCTEKEAQSEMEVERDSYVETYDDYEYANSYQDYSFWEQENQVRIFIPLSGRDEMDNPEEIKGIGELELPKEYQERAEKLKEAMIQYFEEKYNLDISSKLSRQKLKAFTSREAETTTMGYVDLAEPDILNLNQELFGEYDILFNNTFIHESLHQIGFGSKTPTMLDEGITDALTDLILQEEHIASYPTEIYGAARSIGYQILEADNGIAEFYLRSNENQIQNRINAKLRNVKQPFDQRDAGEFLESMLVGLTYGIDVTFDSYYVAFQAQEICRAYCQTFEPSHQSIDYIRRYYIAKEYEEITIIKEGDRFNFFSSESINN